MLKRVSQQELGKLVDQNCESLHRLYSSFVDQSSMWDQSSMCFLVEIGEVRDEICVLLHLDPLLQLGMARRMRRIVVRDEAVEEGRARAGHM
jgi:hypothetical protein